MIQTQNYKVAQVWPLIENLIVSVNVIKSLYGARAAAVNHIDLAFIMRLMLCSYKHFGSEIRILKKIQIKGISGMPRYLYVQVMFTKLKMSNIHRIDKVVRTASGPDS